jgi:hypothetical protein
MTPAGNDRTPFTSKVGISTAKDVTIGDAIDFIAGFTVHILRLMEEECERTLGILRFPSQGNGHAYRRCQGRTEVMGWVDSGRVGHQGLFHQLPHRSFVPVDHCVSHLLRLEDGEDFWRGIPTGGCGGGARMNRDPDYDPPEDWVLLLVNIAGREAHRHDDRGTNGRVILLQQVNDRGSKCAAPEGVEEGVEDSVGGSLERIGVPESVPGDSEWFGIKV